MTALEGQCPLLHHHGPPVLPHQAPIVCASLAVKAGPRTGAEGVTLYATEHLGLEKRMGSTEPGRTPTWRFWDRDPLDADASSRPSSTARSLLPLRRGVPKFPRLDASFFEMDRWREKGAGRKSLRLRGRRVRSSRGGNRGIAEVKGQRPSGLLMMRSHRIKAWSVMISSAASCRAS